MRVSVRLAFCFLSLFIFGFSPKERELNLQTGKVVNDFSLKNTDGKMVSLSDFKNAKGFIIIFTCNHCPFAKLYPKRFNDLNSKYKVLDVPLIAINSMDSLVYEDETLELMQKKSKEDNFNFPYLQDAMQTVGKNFAAAKTPHAYVIWKEKNNWIIKYSGAIDDNGAEPDKVKKPYVALAVDALLKGKEPETKETKSIGCQIYFRK